MPDQNRLGEPGEHNPNEAMDENESTQGLGPGTGDAAEGTPAVGSAPVPPPPPPPAPSGP